ncbi:hypothetical protein [Fictibacillus sp. NRS-1165]|uniref:hypothetical protein n=1 Tax=Fictibacillus sp. NRS-1165 TaxID=3144463 RepID=UPI003D23AAAB
MGYSNLWDLELHLDNQDLDRPILEAQETRQVLERVPVPDRDKEDMDKVARSIHLAFK